MKLIITGTAVPEYDSKNVEINGKPMLRILGPMKTDSGELLPITIWGESKCSHWKKFAESSTKFSIVVELQAKPTTFTNHEGETTTIPNVQLKLYSFLNLPNTNNSDNQQSQQSQQNQQSFYFAPPPQPKTYQTNHPNLTKVKPWPTNNGIEQQEVWGLPF